MIIKLQFRFINYSDVTIIIAHINTNNKTGKHMTILVIKLNESGKRVSTEVLGQDRLGGKGYLIKEGLAKRKLELNVHTAFTFLKYKLD